MGMCRKLHVKMRRKCEMKVLVFASEFTWWQMRERRPRGVGTRIPSEFVIEKLTWWQMRERRPSGVGTRIPSEFCICES